LLVVDDDAFSRKLMAMYLAPLGGEVLQAASGAECLQRVAEGVPQLVLMDCQMPEMDGFETVTRLRAQGYEGVILALTGNSDEVTLQRCREVGMNGHLSKPIQAPALKQAVQQALGLADGSAAAASPPIAAQPTVNPTPESSSDDDDPTARVRELARSANSPALLQRLAAAFAKNSGAVMAEIEAAQGQVERLQALGHKLRGSAGSFGAHRLSELAGRLESAPESDLGPLLEEWARVRKLLQALMDGGCPT
jgi:CheY-like chemotaxis protein/HPt (histidine-containing phosphotransfer) domain-containing protein